MSLGDREAEGFSYAPEAAAIRLKVELHAYRIEAIQKAGYRLAQQFTLVVEDVTDSKAVVVLMRSPAERRPDAEIVSAFYRELADQELRERIADDTKDIRALLLAHAFSRTDLVRRD
jgi:His-Xaa-Ser system protein HxsD